MSLSRETEVIFDSRRGQDYHSANPPLYDSSTFHQTVLGGNAQYDYARSGNPNRTLLEEKLARLEGGKYAFAYASGISTCVCVYGKVINVSVPPRLSANMQMSKFSKNLATLKALLSLKLSIPVRPL